MIDYFTPNETEASFYVDHDVETHDDAEKAAMQLLDKGIKNVVITLGEKGAFFAKALTEGQNIKDALKFASATAGLSTTKIGTANSMPSREEIDKLL